MLEKGKTYYLAHPLSTAGDVGENYSKERECYKRLKELPEFPAFGLIRPLICLPDVRYSQTNRESAMSRCMELMNAADVLILSPGWRDSRGCYDEYCYALGRDMEIIEFERIFSND